jgi:hypothetical protein
MDNIDSIKARVKKLLALSKSPNENEAMAALEKAQELIKVYGLGKSECLYQSVEVKSTKRYVPWRGLIGGAVSWLYNCHHYRDVGHGTFVFTGDSFDAFMAGEMYTYLAKTIERIARQNIRKNAKAKFRRDFKWGMASRLYDRIETLGKACSWAPEREVKIKTISTYVETALGLTSGTATKKVKLNFAAVSKGASAANGISLNRQTTASAGRNLEYKR